VALLILLVLGHWSLCRRTRSCTAVRTSPRSDDGVLEPRL